LFAVSSPLATSSAAAAALHPALYVLLDCWRYVTFVTVLWWLLFFTTNPKLFTFCTQLDPINQLFGFSLLLILQVPCCHQNS
jgi:hypothetical protein